MQYFLVGGAVRDLLLGRPPREYDITLDAEALLLIQANPLARKVGKTHEIWLLNGLEHSLLRGADIQADLMARDFTINALALDPDGRIYFHPQALADLKAGLIRPCTAQSLEHDPVRSLRAARFCASLPGFSLTPECRGLMAASQLSGALAGIVAEQACNETMKALRAPQPGNYLRALCQGQVLLPWYGELDGADKIPGGPPQYHDSSVLEHIARVMDAVAATINKEEAVQEVGVEDDYPACSPASSSVRSPVRSIGLPVASPQTRPLAVWMAMCHDLGKTLTPKEEWPHHYGHEFRGVHLAKSLGERLSLPSKFIKAGEVAAKLHMKAGLYPDLKAATKVGLLTELHYYGLLEPFSLLVEADSGLELRERMRNDMRKMLAVKLAEKDMNLGAESGEKLRQLRCKALKK